ncbi:Glycosyl hydrolases family 43 [Planctomycetes bacterium CA13]|uniref:Glycosyl hydrolases family 43 n=1 Tax=Novipirellula herctigrandis TaxID=2527986 RepID=A0A5C5Z8C3_9BACT|nr:Glycosyl hydrolases family 43 [Planctomycetes bacterium CA13]
MFYSQRRANLKYLPGVGYCYGTDIGMAESTDGGQTWNYIGEAIGLEYEGGRNSWWAPEVVYANAQYHMFVSRIKGIYTEWGGVAVMLHFTSDDLRNWTFSDELPMHNVIDPAIFPMTDGNWRMYYKQDSKTLMIDSPDLKNWSEVGIAADDAGQEGPNVFRWKGHYWMIADVWHGQQIYRSDDLTDWTLQDGGTILGEPGVRRDDAAFGRHADVIVQGDRAFILYFTHPGGDTDHDQATSLKRTSVQVAELTYQNGKIFCDRNQPLNYRWDPDGLDW